MPKILICDDSPNQIDLLKTFLESVGHSVVSAPDPLSLISVGKIQKPDIIFVDMQMPAGGGAQAVKNIEGNAALSTAKIIICSGMPEDAAMNLIPEEFRVRVRYLPKPVDLNRLMIMVKELLGDAKPPAK